MLAREVSQGFGDPLPAEPQRRSALARGALRRAAVSNTGPTVEFCPATHGKRVPISSCGGCVGEKPGDLGGAQQAYSALQKLLPNQNQTQSSQQATSASNPISTDFQALGQALQSGDLTSAQSAFSQLQTDLKSASQSGSSGVASSLTQGVRHHHHHHASSSSSSASSSSTSTTDSSSSSGSSGQTVNLLV